MVEVQHWRLHVALSQFGHHELRGTVLDAIRAKAFDQADSAKEIKLRVALRIFAVFRRLSGQAQCQFSSEQDLHSSN
jgi:hypothetical protein